MHDSAHSRIKLSAYVCTHIVECFTRLALCRVSIQMVGVVAGRPPAFVEGLHSVGSVDVPVGVVHTFVSAHIGAVLLLLRQTEGVRGASWYICLPHHCGAVRGLQFCSTGRLPTACLEQVAVEYIRYTRLAQP
jgi:hypothetical protein